MRNIVKIGFVFGMLCSAVIADELEDNCGCGLGSKLLGHKDSLTFQVLAATTNGIFGNQTFGITSGTLGCEQPISLVSNQKLNEFIAGNMDNLVKDIAMGNGESLDTLAELMNVKSTRRNDFYTKLQANISTVFASGDVNHTQVLNEIVNIYKSI